MASVRPSNIISRLVLVLLVLGTAIVVGSFFRFAEAVATATAPTDPAPADALVVFTGASTERLSTGMALLEAQKGQRLLISGVNEEVRDEEVQALIGGDKTLYECCIVLGRQAEDTVGNARELRAWVGASGVRSIILVTSNFHMQRSLREVREAIPDLEVRPYPIIEPPHDQREWWDNSAAWQGLLQEYAKYLAVSLRQEAQIDLGQGV